MKIKKPNWYPGRCMFRYNYVFASNGICVFSCVYLYFQKILLSGLPWVSELFNMKKRINWLQFWMGYETWSFFGSSQELLNEEKPNHVKLSGMSRIRYLVVTCTHNYFFHAIFFSMNHLNYVWWGMIYTLFKQSD